MDNVASVTCGDGRTAAVKTDGSLWMWGNADWNAFNNGEKGNVQTANGIKYQTIPIKIMDHVDSVFYPEESTPMVLKTDGTLVTWPRHAGMTYEVTGVDTGDGGMLVPWDEFQVDENGNYKYPEPIHATEPLPIKTIMEDVAYVCCGNEFMNGYTQAIIKKDGTLWMSGNNWAGQIGSRKDFSRNFIPYDEPVKVLDNVIAVSIYRGDSVVAVVEGKRYISSGEDPLTISYGWGNKYAGLLADDPFTKEEKGRVKSASFLTTECIDVPTMLSLSVRYPVKQNSSATFPPDSAPTTSELAPVGSFTDVKKSDYFADAVLWAVEKNITSGVGNGLFGPEQTCNRAQILSFLWRASGSPEPTAANPFSDIKSTDYYYKAALWAAEKGMVSGSSFGASMPCTRASTMEYMWKAAGSPAASYNGKFDDVSTSADYAQAVAWAVENNVTAGTSKTTFGPDSTCTRGQIVAFLYRAFAK